MSRSVPLDHCPLCELPSVPDPGERILVDGRTHGHCIALTIIGPSFGVSMPDATGAPVREAGRELVARIRGMSRAEQAQALREVVPTTGPQPESTTHPPRGSTVTEQTDPTDPLPTGTETLTRRGYSPF